MSSLMSLGLRAMTANYAAMQTTGHNIANAGVAGYSRQSVELATSQGQFTGAGFMGKGVEVANITRAHDRFLAMQASVAKSLAAMDSARAAQLSQLEGVFPPGEQGIGYAVGEFLNAMADVANNPTDLSARQVVLSRAQEVSDRFSFASEQLQNLQSGVTQDLKSSVDVVNTITARIAELNGQIAAYTGTNRAPNDLLDARDKAISDLSQYMQVTTIAADDGSVGVFAAGGQRLVLGGEAQKLVVTPDTMDPARSAISISDNGLLRPLNSSMMMGGSIAGMLRFQNDDLVAARNQLGQMAAALTLRVNEMQSYGLDLRQPPGSGAPLFAIGAPQALPASTNAKAADGSYLANVSLTITDGSALQASDYELRADPNGASGVYQLTRLSDGMVSTVSSGDVVDGVRIDIGTPAPQASDRFLLRPVAYAADGMETVLNDPRGLAAASAVTATLGVSNTGTATVNSLTVADASLDPSLTTNITFTSDTGAYAWELRDPATNALISSGTGTWTAGQAISMNGFDLKLDGVPANGDTLSVSPTAHPEANNGNALALLNLRDAGMVNGHTITDAYASVMADIGVRSQSAQMSSEISASASANADGQLTSTTGVNLDEEAANLIQFQQGYQAAAKVLQVAQSVFDTMLQIGR